LLDLESRDAIFDPHRAYQIPNVLIGFRPVLENTSRYYLDAEVLI